MVMIIVSAPKEEGLRPAEVKAMMMSLSLADEPPGLDDQIAALPFTVKPAAPFRLVSVLSGSNAIMTVGPVDIDKTQTQPFLAVMLNASSWGMNAETISNQMLTGLVASRFEPPMLSGSHPVQFAGASGWLLEGSTVLKQNRRPRRFLQYVSVPEPNGHFVYLFVDADSKDFDALKQAIDDTAKSVAVR